MNLQGKQHLAIMEDGAGTEWLEPVDEAVYAKVNYSRL